MAQAAVVHCPTRAAPSHHRSPWSGRQAAALSAAPPPPDRRQRRQRRHAAAAAGSSPGSGGPQDEDDAPPQVMGDWRAFRAKLVADSGSGNWAARMAQANLQLLQMQSPALAQEELWAHPTGAPELGGLLLATPDAPHLLGDQYWQAVVFLVQHDAQGSAGFILNRPTSLKMGRGRGGVPMSIDGMEALRDAFSEARLYCGGFSAQQVLSLLHGQKRLEGCAEVVPGIYLGGHEAAVAEVATGGLQQNDFRFFAGVCAWEPGQLAREVAQGAWYTAACSRSLVLKQCLQLPTPLWREAMCLMGGEYADTAKREQRADEGSDDDE